jgi:hypothetical protein
MLILGTYTVQVEKEGFKTFVGKGILLVSGADYRQDVALEVGAVTQTVEVTGSPVMINVENPEVAHVVNERYYADLPIIATGETRLPEQVLYMEPGFIPTKYATGTGNGDTAGQFLSRMNGGQSASTENYLDGASYGEVSGHNFTQERSAPYEGIKEMRVIDSSFSAQYGRTSGGFIEYTSKSGTSVLHGDAYEYLDNSVLNARDWFAPVVTPYRQNNFGFTLGGPVVIPKVYDGRKRTYFFTCLDLMRSRPGIAPNYDFTTPALDFRTGDFSRLLNLTTTVATDVLGRPVYSGEIFNPSTTREVGGIPVRDGYGFDPVTGLPITGSANIIPATDPLRSKAAANYIPFLPTPSAATLFDNATRSPENTNANYRTLLIRVDHQFKENLKAASTFNQTARPRDLCSNSPGGCLTEIGTGFFQNILTKTFHQQFDWILRPNLFNHTTLAFDRWNMTGHALKNGIAAQLGFKGLVDSSGGPPAINWTGNIPYTSEGEPWPNPGSYATDRWQFLDDLTWIKGKHTLKGGYEFRYHIIPYSAWQEPISGNWNFNWSETAGYDVAGNSLTQSGDPFASFILGQIHSASFSIPPRPQWTERYMAEWVNDEIKVSKNLTLNIGLRFDYQTALREKYDRYSSFEPNLANPAAGGIPGAMAFAGTGPGRTGSTVFLHPPKDDWGPRFGFAYRLTDKNVIRGGYGIYYSGVTQNAFLSNPSVGFGANPTAANMSNGLYPAFYLDDGFPQSLIPSVPQIDPSIANGTSPIYVNPDGYTMPRYQNWSLTVERQFTPNLMLDISYIGNHGTRLVNWGSANGTLSNINDPKYLALGSSLLGADINSTDQTIQAAIAAAGIKKPYPTFTGTVAQALRPYPQYQSITYFEPPVGYSTFNSLQVKLEKRFSFGLQARIGYTWSKFINNGAESMLTGNNPPAVQDPNNAERDLRSLSSDNIPQMLLIAYTYQLPIGQNKKFLNKGGPLDKLIGGWTIAGLQRYDAGRPLGITMANDMAGLLFNDVKRPNALGGGYGITSGYDPNRGDRYLEYSGWADPGPLKFGNEPRMDPKIRGFHSFNENVNLMKDTRLYKEKLTLRFEASSSNVLNRHTFCDPDTNWSSITFGTTFSTCVEGRVIQGGLKLLW